MNKKGNQNFDLWSIKSWVSSRDFLPTSFLANLSPSLSPMKNKAEVEMKTEIKFEIKAILLPKIAIPRTTKEVFKSGTKHKKISINAVKRV